MKIPQQITPSFPPDIETASENYKARFAGRIGRFFLHVQRATILSMLEPYHKDIHNVLEVGGGHAQLTKSLLRKGFAVTVHGSSFESLSRLTALKEQYPEALSLVVGELTHLPFPSKAFDAVVCIRLLAHVEDDQQFVAEIVRVSKRFVLTDFAPIASFNLLYPMLFWLKSILEGRSTRTYKVHSVHRLKRSFRRVGFSISRVRREFFLPMVIHRRLGETRFSVRAEAIALVMGLTALFGSPAVLLAEEFESESRRLNKISVVQAIEDHQED